MKGKQGAFLVSKNGNYETDKTKMNDRIIPPHFGRNLQHISQRAKKMTSIFCPFCQEFMLSIKAYFKVSWKEYLQTIARQSPDNLQTALIAQRMLSEHISSNYAGDAFDWTMIQAKKAYIRLHSDCAIFCLEKWAMRYFVSKTAICQQEPFSQNFV